MCTHICKSCGNQCMNFYHILWVYIISLLASCSAYVMYLVNWLVVGQMSEVYFVVSMCTQDHFFKRIFLPVGCVKNCWSLYTCNFIMYKKNTNKSIMFLCKNHAGRVGETKFSNKMTNIQHTAQCTSTTLLHFEHLSYKQPLILTKWTSKLACQNITLLSSSSLYLDWLEVL